MFGFLRLKGCRITPEDKALYGSHFCSVCHAMTRFGGRISSLLTNYDITFWLMLQSALDSNPVRAAERKPCTAVPFRKVSVKPIDDQVSQTLAALNLILVGSKIEDDEQDGERWKAKTGRFLFGRDVTKAKAYLAETGYEIESILTLPQAQLQAEKAEIASLYSLSTPTGKALGEVFATIAEFQKKPELGEVLQAFGDELGRFLYIWDALDDLEDDKKSGNFNAINRVFDSKPYKQPVRYFLHHRLLELQEILNGLALGPEGQLCLELTDSLQRQLTEKLGGAQKTCCQMRTPRGRLAQAGFCDCDCCCDGDCCELDCCSCGSCCDCNICDCNPCDGNDACCEFSCCSPCGDSGDCCGSSGGSSDCCCDCFGGDSYGSDLCYLDLLCCWCDDSNRYSSSRSRSGSQLGLFERFKAAKEDRNLPTQETGDSSRQCPACEQTMIQLTVGQTVLDECRNCGGVWCDDKEIDELAKLVRIPHNLVNRYPTETAATKCLPGERTCPACKDQELFGVPYLGVAVEMCRKCHGFWLEHGVLRKVINAKRSPKRLMRSHKKEWRCPYCDTVSQGGDICSGCGAPRPKSGFTGKLA